MLTRPCLRALFVIVGLSSLPSAVAAQEVVVLPVHGDAGLEAERGAEARAMVENELDDAGMVVLTPAIVDARTTSATVEPCGDVTCAAAQLSAIHAQMAVSVALSRGTGSVQVVLVLIDPEGHQVSATADGTEESLSQAVLAALAQARARWSSRGGMAVRVVGAPAGASVEVDDVAWGTVPHEGTLAPGPHRFVVRTDGFVTESRDVDVGAQSDALELRFELVPAAALAGGPDVALVAVGSVLAVAGIAGVIVAIVGATTAESCAAGCEQPGPDRTVVRPAVGPIVAWGAVGGAALVTGVVLIGVGASASGGPAVQARLGAGGLVVTF